ncbi:MAG: type II toxin-antitoxin system VapC family toxin [Eggerthellaceae bacterium]|nr:type II toxin-antitoxin system VapC family toxin [Eggerthellaceae bacterium]
MIVLDCCAAVDIVRKTPEGNALRMLIVEDEMVVSSGLFPIEAASTMNKLVRVGVLEAPIAALLLRNAVDLVRTFVPITENYIEAFNEGRRLNHSVYDMLYFTLARRNAATLVTLDKRLREICEEQGVDCIHEVAF